MAVSKMVVDVVGDGDSLALNVDGEDVEDANGVVERDLGRDDRVERVYGMVCGDVKYMMFEANFVESKLRKYFDDDREEYVGMTLDFDTDNLVGRIVHVEVV